MQAKLRFTYGAMGCCKSLRLLTTAYDLEEKGIEIMVLKPSLDTRDGEGIIHSRAGLERQCVMIDADINLFKLISTYATTLETKFQKLKWVLIDECQFLTEIQVDQLSDVVDKLNINVLCYGLRTDFQSRLFPASKRLFELADDIEEIKTTCACGEEKASINARFNEFGEIVTQGEQVVVGGDDIYKAICRKCWKKKIMETTLKET